MNFDGRKCSQRTEVDLLPYCLMRVRRGGFYAGREIPDAVNFVVRKALLAELDEVEPAEGRALERTVIEVESVDVEVGSNCYLG